MIGSCFLHPCLLYTYKHIYTYILSSFKWVIGFSSKPKCKSFFIPSFDSFSVIFFSYYYLFPLHTTCSSYTQSFFTLSYIYIHIFFFFTNGQSVMYSNQHSVIIPYIQRSQSARSIFVTIRIPPMDYFNGSV